MRNILLSMYATLGLICIVNAQLIEAFPETELIKKWIDEEWVNQNLMYTISETGPYGSCRPLEREYCWIANGTNDCDGLATWTYNDQDYTSNRITANFNEITEEWIVLTETYSNYDSSWRIASELHQTFINQNFNESFKTFEYDSADRLVLVLTYPSEESDLLPNAKQEYLYDSEGNLMQRSEYIWNVDSELWDLYLTIEYSYNNGQLATELTSFWNENGESLESSSFFTYEYSETETIRYGSNWDSVLMNFVQGSKWTYTYFTGTTELESLLKQTWDSMNETYENIWFHEYSDWCFPSASIEVLHLNSWVLLGNPSSYPILKIEDGQSGVCSLYVLDITGHLQFSKDIKGKTTDYLELPELATFPQGIYCIVLEDETSTQMVKWCKQ